MIEISNIVVSEGSVTEPVTLVEAKAWLQVDHDDHDALLTAMITGARISLERWLNLALVAKDITLDADNTKDDYDVMLFPYAKGVSSVAVSSLDGNDEETVLTTGTDYYVRANSLRIPNGRHYVSYSVVPGTIPEDLKEAIKMEVAERYRARGENSVDGEKGLSEGAKAKAAPYQIVWL
jgi:hypothetical protein